MDLSRQLKKKKKNWNIKVTVIPIVIGALGTIPKGLVKGLEDWKLEDKLRPFRIQHYKDWLEYWEESWRLEETCCHSDSSERPSTNADVIIMLQAGTKGIQV